LVGCLGRYVAAGHRIWIAKGLLRLVGRIAHGIVDRLLGRIFHRRFAGIMQRLGLLGLGGPLGRF